VVLQSFLDIQLSVELKILPAIFLKKALKDQILGKMKNQKEKIYLTPRLTMVLALVPPVFSANHQKKKSHQILLVNLQSKPVHLAIYDRLLRPQFRQESKKFKPIARVNLVFKVLL
jgi:hypothetical protein